MGVSIDSWYINYGVYDYEAHRASIPPGVKWDVRNVCHSHSRCLGGGGPLYHLRYIQIERTMDGSGFVSYGGTRLHCGACVEDGVDGIRIDEPLADDERMSCPHCHGDGPLNGGCFECDGGRVVDLTKFPRGV